MRFVIVPQTGAPVELRSDDGKTCGWFLVEPLEGWFGTPPPKEQAQARATVDGDAFPAALTQGGRSIVLSMAARCASSIEADDLRDQVCGLFGQKLEIIGEGAGGRRRLSGYLADDPAPTKAAGGTLLFCTVALFCPNPVKSGDERAFPASGGSCKVVNEGNAPAWPRVRVTGRCRALEVSLDGRRVTWQGDEENLEIDFATGEASGGTVVVDNAFPVPPGRHELSVTSSGGSVSVLLAPAWR